MYVNVSWVATDETGPVINPAGEHTIVTVPEANAVTLSRL
jgi:hypothetical protein